MMQGNTAKPRHWLPQILPWLFTVVIFVFLLQRIPLEQILAALRQAHLFSYLALMVPYCLWYCLWDALVLTRVISWFHLPVPYRRIVPVRAAAYIVALLNPGLGQGAVALSLHRREKVPLLEITSSLLFLVLLEVVQLALYAALGIFVLHPHLTPVFAPIYAVLIGSLALGLYLARRGLAPLAPLFAWIRQRRDPACSFQPGGPRWQILRTFQLARPWHYGLTLLLKAPNFLLAVLVHYLALQQFGMHIPLGSLLAFLPVVFLVASLPVTVAHLGTSQAAWVYFFAMYAAEPQLLAYSLVAHVTFMVMNGLIGVCFLRQALRLVEAPVV